MSVRRRCGLRTAAPRTTQGRPRALRGRTRSQGVGPRNIPHGPTDTEAIQARGARGGCDATQLPAGAVALGLDVTTVNALRPTFVTIRPNGPRPLASSLDPALNQPPTPNSVTTELAPDGSVRVDNQFGSVDVIIDVVGHDTDHDDRYYTQTEADDRFVAADLVDDPQYLSIPPAAFQAEESDSSVATAGGSLRSFENISGAGDG